MPDRVVLDSSVIAAIFFREDGVAEAAEKIVEESGRIYTVDFAVAEITNIAWKKVVFEKEDRELVKLALEKSIEFIDSVCEVLSSEELYESAFRISVEKGLTAYDSFFIAASEKLAAPLATADRRLYEKAENAILVSNQG
ncbi:type II toxin-antitoxin system VapC family toxin [Geoglobus ahangari]